MTTSDNFAPLKHESPRWSFPNQTNASSTAPRDLEHTLAYEKSRSGSHGSAIE
jgi:hypothetical protein